MFFPVKILTLLGTELEIFRTKFFPKYLQFLGFFLDFVSVFFVKFSAPVFPPASLEECSMGVPAEILAVPRPVNTIVEDRHTDSAKRYAVRERAGVKYVKGRNPMPVNGKVIGHIIDFKFIPKVDNQQYSEPTCLQYGAVKLAKNFSDDIYSDLLSIYPAKDATTIMAIATLNFIYPDNSAYGMNVKYRKTFVNKYYPGAPISKNSISNLYNNIGTDEEKMEQFFKRRIERVEKDRHVIIDGTLKQDNSIVNDLAKYAHKSRVKGIKVISLVYIYDLELMEPICAQVFPSNYVDSRSFPSLLKKYDVKNGLFIADKALSPEKFKDLVNLHHDLGYLVPLKRNSRHIDKHNLLDFEGELSGVYEIIYYKKVVVSDNLYVYSFKNQEKANDEATSFGFKIKKDDSFDIGIYKKKNEAFWRCRFSVEQGS